MGYSTKPDVIDKVRNHINDMLNSEDEIIWVHPDPQTLRYLILQAFHAAAANAEELGEPYRSIALLRDKFKLRASGKRLVAEPRKITPLASLRVQAQQKVVIKDVFESAEIIAAIGLHKAQEIVFEGVDANDLNLKGLYEVAKKHGYFMIPSTTHLTFSKHKDDEELAWTPEEV